MHAVLISCATMAIATAGILISGNIERNSAGSNDGLSNGEAVSYAQASTTLTGQVWDGIEQSLDGGSYDDDAVDESIESVLSQSGYFVIGGDDADRCPSWLTDEVMDEALLVGALANSDYSVLSYEVPGLPDDALSQVSEILEGRGWIDSGYGSSFAKTFTKEEGRCRWAMASASQTSEGTTVVLRLQLI